MGLSSPFGALATVVAILFVTVAPQFATAQSTASTSDATTSASAFYGLGAVEARVRAFFADIPAMIPIAQCESKFTQFNDDGSVLHGGLGHGMIGIFQIYESIHADYAASLGMDINTVDGNMAYARDLYERNGTSPWLDSAPCWRKIAPPAPAARAASSDPDDLSLGMIDDRVLALQRQLNAAGFTLATDGPGSPGNETSKFGALTRDAIRAFQCKQGIVCDGDEYSTGYGLVDERTRTALQRLAAAGDTTTTAVTITHATSTPIVVATVSATSTVFAASSTIATGPTASAALSVDDRAALIARLHAQVIVLQQVIAELIRKRVA